MDSDEFHARANAIVAAHPPLPYDEHQEEIELLAMEYAAHELSLIGDEGAERRAATLIEWAASRRRVAARRIRADEIHKERFAVGDEQAERGPRGIRLTHVPTGITVECTAQRSSIRNHVEALTELQDKVVSARTGSSE